MQCRAGMYFVFSCLLWLVAAKGALAQGTVVQASVVSVGGNSQYVYSVQNQSGASIVQLTIGIDDVNSGDPELLTLPVAWDYSSNSGGLITAPVNWEGEVELFEENNYFDVVWGLLPSGNEIAQGQTLTGFAVTLPQRDNRFLTAHWTVFRSDGTSESGTLLSLQPIVVGDVDANGVVNCADVAIVKSSMGLKWTDFGFGFDARADVNLDKHVDVKDLAIVSQHLPAGTRCQ